MNNKEFDNIIKQRISQMKNSSSDASWEMMKAHMDDHSFKVIDSEVDAWDEMIKSKLNDYHIPFNNEHQSQFLDFYNNHRIAKKRELYHFISRVAVILLLIFTGFNLADNFDSSPKNNSDITDNTTKENSTIIIASNNDLIVNGHTKVLPISPILNLPTTNLDSNADLYGFIAPVHEDVEIISNSIPNILYKEELVNIEPMNLSPLDMKVSNIEYANNGTIAMNNVLADILPKAINNNSELLVGAWVSYDRNSNFKKEIISFDDGVTAGLSISKKMGNLEVESGLEYGKVKFTPSQNKTLFSSARKIRSLEVDDIDLVVTSLPINVKYHIPINDKTGVYATVGSKYNAVLVNSSGEKVNDYNLRSPSEKVLKKKPSLKGILQGGDILHNSYITGSVGFGIQRKIDANTLVFFEPEYETLISSKDVSYSDDRLSGINIKFGIKKNI